MTQPIKVRHRQRRPLTRSEKSKLYWQRPEVKDKYAKKRAERYALDDDYAEQERERARRAYQQKAGVRLEGKAAKFLIRKDIPDHITPRQLSEMMGYSPARIVSLIRRGMWPAPKRSAPIEFDRTYESGETVKVVREFEVYTREEAKALARAFAKHEKEFLFYREEHDETRNLLFSAVGQKPPR